MKQRRTPAARVRTPGIPDDLTTQLVERISQLSPSVKTDYLRSELTSKYVSSLTDPPEVRRTRAINKWLATEAENEATNDRLFITPDTYQIMSRVSYSDFVCWCRDHIAGIIGDTAPIEALIGSFSGGASTSRPRTSSHPSSKFSGNLHVTEHCLGLFIDVVDEMPGWINAQNPMTVEIVKGNVLFTVPKKTDIDRVACKEPDLNMFIQKGIGSYFRSCLRRTGINLNDQSINRSLAREGSITGKLATLDLSSASDSVSSGLVELLLPVTWYTLLDSARSPVTIIDGEEHRNHMFSSMGNGFTFELESLIFLVLARAVRHFRRDRGVVSVYGDDIICPTGSVPELTWVLNYFGFSVNLEKSFDSGPFRESCGGHYYDGVDITPFYIRKPIENLEDLIDVANKLRQWGSIPDSILIANEIEPLWLWLKSYVPECLWGGGDTSFKYQLVSNDKSAKRLAETNKRRSTGDGGYYHWLNATWRREEPSDGLETSSMLQNDAAKAPRLRDVREPDVPELTHYFAHELGRVDVLSDWELWKPEGIQAHSEPAARAAWFEVLHGVVTPVYSERPIGELGYGE
ncbi:TPA_asm: RNA-directed RNA polymerase [ssRNA phage Gerhypos.3_19]|uniref:RNA-directed RNA polymerase n=2 Tax=Fiersviridae TaxID=2842319 RepID=A0A8S5KXL8_9VIRU|nr:RNA-directed RNA polymerase [ssRNA phage Gerhypos.3_19]QDH90850.1 MAG: RNA-dependent RNA polymerase [Leviviridae sp.]DAD50113.1 TPA_asm: RNA-directed RNA polymerase [ssRNA phage Gerhypos.3_19]